MPDSPQDPQRNSSSRRDYDRTLGVIESFTVVTEQCPNGAVRSVAERALETLKRGEPGALREQAYFVLTAIQGWRGERASQVHRSLSEFIASSEEGSQEGS
jgi:hypothetical protein